MADGTGAAGPEGVAGVVGAGALPPQAERINATLTNSPEVVFIWVPLFSAIHDVNGLSKGGEAGFHHAFAERGVGVNGEP